MVRKNLHGLPSQNGQKGGQSEGRGGQKSGAIRRAGRSEGRGGQEGRAVRRVGQSGSVCIFAEVNLPSVEFGQVDIHLLWW